MEDDNDNGNDEVDNDDDDDDDDDTVVHIRLLVFNYYDSRERRHTIVIDDLVMKNESSINIYTIVT